MELIYKKADVNDIDALVGLKIKQNIYTCNRNGLILKNEEIARENIKKVLLQEFAINPYAIKLYEKFGFKKDNDKYILNN